MKAVLLIDADSMIYNSCYCKKEEDPEGEGFVRSLETAQWKFDEGFHRVFNFFEENEHEVLGYRVFVQGNNNFRKIINPSYKINRLLTKKPPMFEGLREDVIERYGAYVPNGVETDDCIAATWKSLKETWGDEFVPVIVSPDKDYKQLPEMLFFDYYYTRFDLYYYSEQDAMYNLSKQMITGDSTDGVIGIPKIGEKKAEKILGHADSKFSLLRRVWSAYLSHYKTKNKAYKAMVMNYLMLKLHTENIEIPEYPFEFNQP